MAQLLVRLADRHQIGLLYLRAANDPPLDEALGRQADFTEAVDLGFGVGRAGRWWRRAHTAIGMLGGAPRWVAEWRVERFRARLRAIAPVWRPQVVQMEYHVMGQYVDALDGHPAARVLTEYEPGAAAALERRNTKRGLPRLLGALDAAAWRRYEQTLLRRLDAVVALTERDRRSLLSLGGGARVVQIPLGADLRVANLSPTGATPPSLLFIGNFGHPPNVEAARRLVARILPLVVARCPDTRLVIVGPKPPADLARMASARVAVTGWVKEVGPYLDAAAVVVVPLSQGGGMRVKVMEAVAAGKAVVASRLALEGLALTSGDQVLIAETDEDFADAIVALLQEPVRRAALADRARAWAAAHLGWEPSIAAYERLYGELLASPRSPTGPS
jgi:polysaccharide biosynthesis protein PslH